MTYPEWALKTKLTPEQQSAVLYWPTIAKIPIIPCESKTKTFGSHKWKDVDFTAEDCGTNVAAGLYDNGIALRLGKTLPGCPYLYSFALDFDGYDAVMEFFGSWDNLVSLSKKTRVEWHQNKGRIHVIFFSNRPVTRKRINITKDAAFEVRYDELLIASPSVHGDGNRWSVLPEGTNQTAGFNEQDLLKLEAKIDSLSQGYMSDENKQRYIAWLEDPNTIIKEGSRHDAIKILGCSYYYRYKNGWKDLTDDQRHDKLREWNQQHCMPPLPEEEINAIGKWIVNTHKESRDDQHQQLKDEQRKVTATTALAEEDYPAKLMKCYTLKTLSDTDEIWYYDSLRGIFMPNAEPMIKTRIERDKGMPYIDKNGEMQESKLSTYDVNEYLNHIRRRTLVLREDFNPSIEWLACNNCMLNVKTGEVSPFSPSFINTTHIPVKYVAYNRDHIHSINDFRRPDGRGFIADFFRLVECPCPAIMKFLYEIIMPEDIELVLDFMAYCLWREYRFNLWMLFHGSGQNGKSILLMLIERFFGSHNVSGETLDRLLHERFAVANLFQKMVNIDADMSADVIFNNTGILKKLTGNDLHAAEFKFRKPFAFRNYAKLIFSCNNIPETKDYTDAFFRRIIIINFTQQFFGEKDDPDLIDKICTGEEFSGLLYELLARLPRVLKEGIKKVTNEVLTQTYDKYTRGSNPIKYFVEKGLQRSAHGDKVPKRKMFERYIEFCNEFGLAPESEQSFSRRLTDEFGFQYKRVRINGQPEYCWIDVELRQWKEEEKQALDNLEDFSDATKEVMK